MSQVGMGGEEDGLSIGDGLRRGREFVTGEGGGGRIKGGDGRGEKSGRGLVPVRDVGEGGATWRAGGGCVPEHKMRYGQFRKGTSRAEQKWRAEGKKRTEGGGGGGGGAMERGE